MTSLSYQLQKLRQPLNTIFKPDDRQRPSILFDKKEAASLDRDIFFSLGVNGLQELQALDASFEEYEDLLFSEENKNFERIIETKAVNDELNDAINKFLITLSPYLLLKPSLQTIEWLLHRYHIHVLNMDGVMLCSLPYHDTNYFVKIIQTFNLASKADQRNKWSWLLQLQNKGSPLSNLDLCKQMCADSIFLKFVLSMPEKFIKVHGTNNPKLKTLFGFYASSMIGFIQMAVLQENSISAMAPCLEKGLKSQDTLYILSTYAIITTLSQKIQLTDEFWQSITKLICKNLNWKLIDHAIKCILNIATFQDSQQIFNRESLEALWYNAPPEHQALLYDTISSCSEKIDTSPLICKLLLCSFNRMLDIVKSSYTDVINNSNTNSKFDFKSICQSTLNFISSQPLSIFACSVPTSVKVNLNRKRKKKSNTAVNDVLSSNETMDVATFTIRTLIEIYLKIYSKIISPTQSNLANDDESIIPSSTTIIPLKLICKHFGKMLGTFDALFPPDTVESVLNHYQRKKHHTNNDKEHSGPLGKIMTFLTSPKYKIMETSETTHPQNPLNARFQEATKLIEKLDLCLKELLEPTLALDNVDNDMVRCIMDLLPYLYANNINANTDYANIANKFIQSTFYQTHPIMQGLRESKWSTLLKNPSTTQCNSIFTQTLASSFMKSLAKKEISETFLPQFVADLKYACCAIFDGFSAVQENFDMDKLTTTIYNHIDLLKHLYGLLNHDSSLHVENYENIILTSLNTITQRLLALMYKWKFWGHKFENMSVDTLYKNASSLYNQLFVEHLSNNKTDYTENLKDEDSDENITKSSQHINELAMQKMLIVNLSQIMDIMAQNSFDKSFLPLEIITSALKHDTTQYELNYLKCELIYQMYKFLTIKAIHANVKGLNEIDSNIEEFNLFSWMFKHIFLEKFIFASSSDIQQKTSSILSFSLFIYTYTMDKNVHSPDSNRLLMLVTNHNLFKHLNNVLNRDEFDWELLLKYILVQFMSPDHTIRLSLLKHLQSFPNLNINENAFLNESYSDKSQKRLTFEQFTNFAKYAIEHVDKIITEENGICEVAKILLTNRATEYALAKKALKHLFLHLKKSFALYFENNHLSQFHRNVMFLNAKLIGLGSRLTNDQWYYLESFLIPTCNAVWNDIKTSAIPTDEESTYPNLTDDTCLDMLTQSLQCVMRHLGHSLTHISNGEMDSLTDKKLEKTCELFDSLLKTINEIIGTCLTMSSNQQMLVEHDEKMHRRRLIMIFMQCICDSTFLYPLSKLALTIGSSNQGSTISNSKITANISYQTKITFFIHVLKMANISCSPTITSQQNNYNHSVDGDSVLTPQFLSKLKLRKILINLVWNETKHFTSFASFFIGKIFGLTSDMAITLARRNFMTTCDSINNSNNDKDLWESFLSVLTDTILKTSNAETENQYLEYILELLYQVACSKITTANSFISPKTFSFLQSIIPPIFILLDCINDNLPGGDDQNSSKPIIQTECMIRLQRLCLKILLCSVEQPLLFCLNANTTSSKVAHDNVDRVMKSITLLVRDSFQIDTLIKMLFYNIYCFSPLKYDGGNDVTQKMDIDGRDLIMYQIDNSNIDVRYIRQCIIHILAGVAPVFGETLVHSVFSLFTFMGKREIEDETAVIIKSKITDQLEVDNAYSFETLDSVIDILIPACINQVVVSQNLANISFEDFTKALLKESIKYLLCFTDAFEHIPSHRRIPIYSKLLTVLSNNITVQENAIKLNHIDMVGSANENTFAQRSSLPDMFLRWAYLLHYRQPNNILPQENVSSTANAHCIDCIINLWGLLILHMPISENTLDDDSKSKCKIDFMYYALSKLLFYLTLSTHRTYNITYDMETTMSLEENREYTVLNDFGLVLPEANFNQNSLSVLIYLVHVLKAIVSSMNHDIVNTIDKTNKTWIKLVKKLISTLQQTYLLIHENNYLNSIVITEEKNLARDQKHLLIQILTMLKTISLWIKPATFVKIMLKLFTSDKNEKTSLSPVQQYNSLDLLNHVFSTKRYNAPDINILISDSEHHLYVNKLLPFLLEKLSHINTTSLSVLLNDINAIKNFSKPQINDLEFDVACAQLCIVTIKRVLQLCGIDNVNNTNMNMNKNTKKIINIIPKANQLKDEMVEKIITTIYDTLKGLNEFQLKGFDLTQNNNLEVLENLMNKLKSLHLSTLLCCAELFSHWPYHEKILSNIPLYMEPTIDLLSLNTQDATKQQEPIATLKKLDKERLLRLECGISSLEKYFYLPINRIAQDGSIVNNNPAINILLGSEHYLSSIIVKICQVGLAITNIANSNSVELRLQRLIVLLTSKVRIDPVLMITGFTEAFDTLFIKNDASFHNQNGEGKIMECLIIYFKLLNRYVKYNVLFNKSLSSSQNDTCQQLQIVLETSFINQWLGVKSFIHGLTEKKVVKYITHLLTDTLLLYCMKLSEGKLSSFLSKLSIWWSSESECQEEKSEQPLINAQISTWKDNIMLTLCLRLIQQLDKLFLLFSHVWTEPLQAMLEALPNIKDEGTDQLLILIDIYGAILNLEEKNNMSQTNTTINDIPSLPRFLTKIYIQDILWTCIKLFDSIQEYESESLNKLYCLIASMIYFAKSEIDLSIITQYIMDIARHTDPKVRIMVIHVLKTIFEKCREEFLTTLPQMVTYIADWLEDENEDVEQACHSLVETIESLLGEPLQKYF